jgi:glycosyltransferase involved in cell wall biosynthesis
MKILIVIDSLGSGGAERSTAVMVDFLRKENVEFKILCLDKKEVGVQKELLKKGYDIEFLKDKSFHNQIREIVQIIKRANFDIVHSILFRSNLRVRFARMLIKFNHIESLVNTTYSSERFNDRRVNSKLLKIYKNIDKITAKRYVDHFHSITETVKNHYIKELDLKNDLITVVYRGRKPILEKFENKRFNSDKPFKILNVGRHEFQKGQIYLLKAAHKLKDLGYKFKLDIYGREGATTPELKEYIHNNKLDDRIHLKGFNNNISEKLLSSDLFIFPSLYEGLGGALIEAQAAGLPIACNDIEVLHEVVSEDENAKFFDVHSIDSIVDAIKYFLDKPDKIKEYGRSSFKNYNNKFQEEENNRKMLNLYMAVCSNSGK